MRKLPADSGESGFKRFVGSESWLSETFSLLGHDFGVKLKVKARETLWRYKLPAHSNESDLKRFLETDSRLSETMGLLGYGLGG